ncbi:MAG TPA: hypothetical protein VGB64_07700 [Actinomycetota bacterium]
MIRNIKRLSIVMLLVAAAVAGSAVPASADIYGVMTTVCERTPEC